MRAKAMKAGSHVKNAHREMMAVVQGQTKTHTHLRRRLLTIFLATAFIAVISTLVVYFTESGAKHTEIHNLFDAFLFSTSQLLTASSVAAPKTNFGKVLELFFDIWAITVVATLAGSFGAFFHQRSKEMDAQLDGVEKRLAKEVEELRERL
jgi:Na+/melibiose symporter-like transporter